MSMSQSLPELVRGTGYLRGASDPTCACRGIYRAAAAGAIGSYHQAASRGLRDRALVAVMAFTLVASRTESISRSRTTTRRRSVIGSGCVRRMARSIRCAAITSSMPISRNGIWYMIQRRATDAQSRLLPVAIPFAPEALPTISPTEASSKSRSAWQGTPMQRLLDPMTEKPMTLASVKWKGWGSRARI